MKQAEMSFIRKLGKLRYLNHLRKTNEVENCPVCTSKPEHKVYIPSDGEMYIDKMQNANAFNALILFQKIILVCDA